MAKRSKASKKLPKLERLESLYGRRQVQQLDKHLRRLRQVEREDAHGNRELFLSDIFVAQLLAFHQPLIRSLRTLDALSCTSVAQEHLVVDRIPRSTLSDANRVVDAKLLEPLLQDLLRRVDTRHVPKDLETLTHRLVAVDGTFLRVVGELAWALQQRTDNGLIVSKPRLDVQLDVGRGVPRFAVLSGHEQSECNAARLHIEAGKIYVGDKAYFGFALLRDWIDNGADFVVALNSQIHFTPSGNVTPRRQLGKRILSDRRGHLPGCDKSTPPTRELREVIVLRDDNDEPLRLLTTLTDPCITAETVGEIYRRRWTIELFFRWLKTCANYRHVISHSPNGLSVALYVAIIATLLSALATGQQPSKYTVVTLGLVASGMAELKEILPILERYEREREQARQRYRRRKASK
jgi:hypothetical protein